jgi:hypothetical protein
LAHCRNLDQVDLATHVNESDSRLLVQQQQEEIQNLSTQNEQLRNTVTDLREKLAKVKMNPTAASGVKRQQNSEVKKERETLNSNQYDQNPSQIISSVDIEKISVPLLNNIGPSPFDLTCNFEEYQQLQQQAPSLIIYLSNNLEKGIMPIVEVHPLANFYTEEAVLFVCKEVTKAVLETSAVALFLLLLKQENEFETYQSLLSGDLTLQQLHDSTRQSTLDRTIQKLLKLSLIQNDAGSFSTLYFTYLNHIFHIKGLDNFSSPKSIQNSTFSTVLPLKPISVDTSSTLMNRGISVGKHNTLNSGPKVRSMDNATLGNFIERTLSTSNIRGNAESKNVPVDDSSELSRKISPTKENLPRYMLPKSKLKQSDFSDGN